MRLFLALFLVVHGAAHLVGFVGAWRLVKTAPYPTTLFGGMVDLGNPGAKAVGVLWLLLAAAYALAATLVVTRSALALPITLTVSVVSLLLCVGAWPETKIGVIIDVLLITGALLLGRQTDAHAEARFRKELAGAGLRVETASGGPISESDIATLPEPVRRYLGFMGVVGKPRDWSLRARFHALFRRDAGAWIPCDALQYDTRLDVARVFHMRLLLKGAVPVFVRDTYLHGSGRMQARAFDLIPVVDGKGFELDVGELVTYLNDAILMAPSLILGPETTWTAVTPDAFDVTFTDHGHSVRARVFIDARGAPTNFSTTDRFFDAPDGRRIRTEWNTPIDGWQNANGRRLPTRGRAVWMLPAGPLAYGDFRFDPTTIAFNVPPTG